MFNEQPIEAAGDIEPRPIQYKTGFRAGDDGYDWMAQSATLTHLSGYGLDGWDCGDWPYVIISWGRFRTQLGEYAVIVHVEGDLSYYGYKTAEERQDATDWLVHWYWRRNPPTPEFEAMYALASPVWEHAALGWLIPRLPDRFKGPFSWKRLEAEKDQVPERANDGAVIVRVDSVAHLAQALEE